MKIISGNFMRSLNSIEMTSNYNYFNDQIYIKLKNPEKMRLHSISLVLYICHVRV